MTVLIQYFRVVVVVVVVGRRTRWQSFDTVFQGGGGGSKVEVTVLIQYFRVVVVGRRSR